MPTLRAPEASSDVVEHADWLELLAIIAGDSESSGHDFTNAISRAGSIDAASEADELDDDEPLDEPVEGEDDKLEVIADGAFELLAERQDVVGAAYPFRVDGSLLTAKDGAVSSPYAFLAALTHFGPLVDKAQEGASLFERISGAALVEYLGGAGSVCSYDFGSPRRDTFLSFRRAIDDLCEKMGDGGGHASRMKSSDMKDAGLDLVVWVPFGDDRLNQLSVFGQCAAGGNWRAKLTELQPVQFCSSWMKDPPVLSPLAAFFVPRQIGRAHWEIDARHDRQLLFDRLRIARLLGSLDAEVEERCATWTAAALG